MSAYPEDLRELVERAPGRAALRSRLGDRRASRRRCATRCSPAASGSGRCSRWRRPGRSAREPERYLPAAAAIELIHTYSLIHDDLPAMDDDELRRGIPTSHVKFGEDVAILAGDGLFAEAVRLFCEQPGEPERVLAALRELAAATGVDGMVGGQYVDVTQGELDAEQLRALHELKTGRLIAASVGVVLAARGAQRT